MQPAIELIGACKRYEKFTLDHLSLTVPQGSVVGFIGENGAGKTTTIKAICRLIHLDAGQVRILGENVAEDGQKARERLGVMLDGSFFNGRYRAREIDSILSSIHPDWDHAMFDSLLESFQLPRDQAIRTYSRGMRVKLSLVTALAHHPRILLLDEPTSGLDPIARGEVLDILYTFMQEETHSILLSSHITTDLEKIADYIVMIHGGKKCLDCRKDMLLDTHGLLKGPQQAIDAIDPALIVASRYGSFGGEALVNDRAAVQRDLPHGAVLERCNLEQIMEFYVEGLER